MNLFTAFFALLALAGAIGLVHTHVTDRRDRQRLIDAQRVLWELMRHERTPGNFSGHKR